MPHRSEAASLALRVSCCLWSLAWLLGCGPRSPLPAAELDDAESAEEIAGPELARLGEGFAVWESNRSGDWRIWSRRLDGGGLRRLSPDDGQQHCCPHISPNGRRVVYLSRSISRDNYDGWETAGALRSLDPVSGAEQTLVSAARTYGWGNRCAVWRDDRRLIYVDGDGSTRLLEVDEGVSRPLTAPRAAGELPWLIDPSLRFATSADPSFSPYDADARRVLDRGSLGGCEPYFSHDGRWGYWIAGAGGPVHRIELATREVSTLLRKSDPRMPGDQAYVYFPMLSRDGWLFAFGASADEHNHFRSNYDVYVSRSDPRTLELIGEPIRLTSHPASDRYPDVFLAPLELGRHAGEAPLTVELAPRDVAGELAWDYGDGARETAAVGRHTFGEPGTYEVRAVAGERVLRAQVVVEEPRPPRIVATPDAEAGPSWPSDRRGLVFLWQTSDEPNLVHDPELGADVSYPLEPRGRARLDHDHAMVLDGGAFTAPAEAARALLAAAVATNELTLEATLRTDDLSQAGPATILTFSRQRRQRNLTLGQEGSWLVLRIRTASTGADADRPQVRLFELVAGRTLHLAVTYSPGLLHVYRDGELVEALGDVRAGLNRWQPGELLFGDEVDGGAGWSGTLEGIALFNRVLAPAEVRADYLRYRRMLERRPEVERLEVRATLRARSEIPTLDQISPYRKALAVYEYQVDEVVDGEVGSEILRVAHWVILDGETLPVAAARRGTAVRLILEPFADNPQLDSHYLSQTLEPGGDPGLFYAVGP
jgi:hypothetical protein